MHLHGELRKVRSIEDESLVYKWEEDLTLDDKNEFNHQLRPHIVWFGEEVPLLYDATQIVELADILVIIGTSMQVYPAASLIHYVKSGTPIYFIDPNPAISSSSHENLTIIKKTAVEGTKELIRLLNVENS